MHYDKTKPCDNCPFLREGGVTLHPDRAEEIAELMLRPGNGSFICHKTKDCKSNDMHHCTGALIFAERNGNATQTMRIAERIGLYDRTKLMSNKQITDLVFDDIEGMVDSHGLRYRTPAKV